MTYDTIMTLCNQYIVSFEAIFTSFYPTILKSCLCYMDGQHYASISSDCSQSYM